MQKRVPSLLTVLSIEIGPRLGGFQVMYVLTEYYINAVLKCRL